MPKITSAATVLLVKDVMHSANWYKDKCGFTIQSVFGEPVNFAIIQRDGHFLMLQKANAADIKPNWKVVGGIWNAYFWVDDVDAIYAEFIKNGATIDYKLHDKPYGVREFGINDPDEYDIAFGQVI